MGIQASAEFWCGKRLTYAELTGKEDGTQPIPRMSPELSRVVLSERVDPASKENFWLSHRYEAYWWRSANARHTRHVLRGSNPKYCSGLSIVRHGESHDSNHPTLLSMGHTGVKENKVSNEQNDGDAADGYDGSVSHDRSLTLMPCRF